MLPNLIIAGPPKTGTTSLFDWLSKHPDVCPAIKKETSYFSDSISNVNTKNNFINHGLEKYAELFNYQSEKIIMEATPEYIFCNTALINISKLQTDPLILFIYRNQADRFRSEYLFHKYKTKRFNGAFIDYLNDKKKGQDFIFYLRKWVEKSYKIKVLFFEDLINYPHELLRILCHELTIDAAFLETVALDKKNVSVNLRNKSAHKLAEKIVPFLPANIKRMGSELYFKINTKPFPLMNEKEIELFSSLEDKYENEESDLISEFKAYILRP